MACSVVEVVGVDGQYGTIVGVNDTAVFFVLVNNIQDRAALPIYDTCSIVFPGPGITQYPSRALFSVQHGSYQLMLYSCRKRVDRSDLHQCTLDTLMSASTLFVVKDEFRPGEPGFSPTLNPFITFDRVDNGRLSLTAKTITPWFPGTPVYATDGSVVGIVGDRWSDIEASQFGAVAIGTVKQLLEREAARRPTVFKGPCSLFNLSSMNSLHHDCDQARLDQQEQRLQAKRERERRRSMSLNARKYERLAQEDRVAGSIFASIHGSKQFFNWRLGADASLFPDKPISLCVRAQTGRSRGYRNFELSSFPLGSVLSVRTRANVHEVQIGAVGSQKKFFVGLFLGFGLQGATTITRHYGGDSSATEVIDDSEWSYWHFQFEAGYQVTRFRVSLGLRQTLGETPWFYDGTEIQQYPGLDGSYWGLSPQRGMTRLALSYRLNGWWSSASRERARRLHLKSLEAH